MPRNVERFIGNLHDSPAGEIKASVPKALRKKSAVTVNRVMKRFNEKQEKDLRSEKAAMEQEPEELRLLRGDIARLEGLLSDFDLHEQASIELEAKGRQAEDLEQIWQAERDQKRLEAKADSAAAEGRRKADKAETAKIALRELAEKELAETKSLLETIPGLPDKTIAEVGTFVLEVEGSSEKISQDFAAAYLAHEPLPEIVQKQLAVVEARVKEAKREKVLKLELADKVAEAKLLEVVDRSAATEAELVKGFSLGDLSKDAELIRVVVGHALDEGSLSPEELKAAIDVSVVDPYFLGKNDRKDLIQWQAYGEKRLGFLQNQARLSKKERTELGQLQPFETYFHEDGNRKDALARMKEVERQLPELQRFRLELAADEAEVEALEQGWKSRVERLYRSEFERFCSEDRLSFAKTASEYTTARDRLIALNAATTEKMTRFSKGIDYTQAESFSAVRELREIAKDIGSSQSGMDNARARLQEGYGLRLGEVIANLHAECQALDRKIKELKLPNDRLFEKAKAKQDKLKVRMEAEQRLGYDERPYVQYLKSAQFEIDIDQKALRQRLEQNRLPLMKLIDEEGAKFGQRDSGKNQALEALARLKDINSKQREVLVKDHAKAEEDLTQAKAREQELRRQKIDLQAKILVLGKGKKLADLAEQITTANGKTQTASAEKQRLQDQIDTSDRLARLLAERK